MKGNGSCADERIRIQEKALSNMADMLKKQETEITDEIGDILTDLKAIKLYLARNHPEFKKQFPEIRRKLR